ncbi:hypothetical protein E8E13_010026 [Curvularia kusanoi]|uniref:Uncharacterized protein n=1 Tax=Curvularia kusanoi TaxID=90978 RepID=A0A9P4TJB5_CURKU|nr:hypothetical protein E8E13_010026 [Curvularia kusanoi]
MVRHDDSTNDDSTNNDSTDDGPLIPFAREDFYPSGETAEQTLIRIANRDACLQEARTQEERWAAAYQDHIVRTAYEVERSTGEAKAIATEQIAYLREVTADPPRCKIADFNSLRTIEDAMAAFRPNFHELTSADRQRIWGLAGARADADRPARRPNLTMSHIASVLKDAQKVVDIRCLLEITPRAPLYLGGLLASRGYQSMWRNRFAVTCDILLVVIPQEIHDYVAVRNPDVVVRAGAAFSKNVQSLNYISFKAL